MIIGKEQREGTELRTSMCEEAISHHLYSAPSSSDCPYVVCELLKRVRTLEATVDALEIMIRKLQEASK